VSFGFLFPLRLSFNTFPVLESFRFISGFFVTENVGVPPQELFADALNHVIEVKPAGFRGDLAMENDLEQKITELFSDLAVFSPVHRFHKFVSFFYDIGLKRFMGLSPVPGAAVRSSEYSHDLKQFINGFFFCSHCSITSRSE